MHPPHIGREYTAIGYGLANDEATEIADNWLQHNTNWTERHRSSGRFWALLETGFPVIHGCHAPDAAKTHRQDIVSPPTPENRIGMSDLAFKAAMSFPPSKSPECSPATIKIRRVLGFKILLRRQCYARTACHV